MPGSTILYLVVCARVLYNIIIFIEAIIQQQSDDIEVLKKELYQHPIDKSDVAVQCSMVSGM